MKRSVNTLSEALVFGRDEDEVQFPNSNLTIGLKGLRELLLRAGFTPAEFAALSQRRQDEITIKLRELVEKQFRVTFGKGISTMVPSPTQQFDIVSPRLERHAAAQMERSRLHQSLVPWASGPLALEMPQGSSYHHLVEYDEANRHPDNPTMKDIAEQYGEPQIIVVQHDWLKSVGAKLENAVGEVRMPFPHTCWEFRISGVRVLAMVRVADESALNETVFFCVYGRDRIWVADDCFYTVGPQGDIGRGHPVNIKHQSIEFSRVARLLWNHIRASCIMLDVRAVVVEKVAASRRLAERRTRERREPPRSHLVVQLAPPVRRYHYARASTVESGRAPQGGHLRRGTYVHFDDVDSGELQYVNDGGFWVSKTWRGWHWAGDLSRMIEREYRL